MRLSRIITRAGDTGQSSLVDGSRENKYSPRFQLIGEVDELNSFLGTLIATWPEELASEVAKDDLTEVQNDLFVIGADLATPWGFSPAVRIGEELVEKLEALCEIHIDETPPLKEFILPGGSRLGSQLHLARAIARRTERCYFLALETIELNPQIGTYLNRLSDYFFIMGRWVNQRLEQTEHLVRFPTPQ